MREIGSGLRLDESQQQVLADVEKKFWIPWTVAVFSGEQAMRIPADDQGLADSLSTEARDLLGGDTEWGEEHLFDFREGELAQRAIQLHKKGDNGSLNRLERVSDASLKLFTIISAHVPDTDEWLSEVPAVPQTVIDEGEQGEPQVVFTGGDTQPVSIEGPLDSVVTYGPGMSGGVFAGFLAGRAGEAYFVSGGLGARFVNEWTKLQLNVVGRGLDRARRFSPGTSAEEFKLPEAYFYEDGIAKTVGSIASRTVARDKPVDAVVMSAAHSAGKDECLAGVGGARRLLRDGGWFVTKAPRISLGDEAGMDVVGPVAEELFGEPVASGECGLLGQFVDPSKPEARPADFAIYQK